VKVDLGMGYVDVPRRSNPNDQCLNDPCWDYDTNGKIVLIGQECTAVTTATAPKVVVLGGCVTAYKP
jgi:hypothetical protein